MREIASHVTAGAHAYLRQQYKVVVIVFVLLLIVFAFLAFGLKVLHPLAPIAFVTGGFFSGLAGFFRDEDGHSCGEPNRSGGPEFP